MFLRGVDAGRCKRWRGAAFLSLVAGDGLCSGKSDRYFDGRTGADGAAWVERGADRVSAGAGGELPGAAVTGVRGGCGELLQGDGGVLLRCGGGGAAYGRGVRADGAAAGWRAAGVAAAGSGQGVPGGGRYGGRGRGWGFCRGSGD